MVFEFEADAIAGKELPHGLSLEEQAVFISLRGLYAQKRAGVIDRETAVREKRELIRTYNEWIKRSAFERKCRQCAVRLWREVECAGNRYAKERTLEHADGLYRAVYGVGVPNSQALGNLRGGGG